MSRCVGGGEVDRQCCSGHGSVNEIDGDASCHWPIGVECDITH